MGAEASRDLLRTGQAPDLPRPEVVSAGLDEASRVITSYLAANAVSIPATPVRADAVAGQDQLEGQVGARRRAAGAAG